MKAIVALLIGMAWPTLPAHAAQPFPANRVLEVVSVDHRDLTHHRPKLLFVRPAFLDDDFPFEAMDVRVATGCNSWGLRVKASRTGAFGPIFLRQSLVSCWDVNDIEQRLAHALLTTARWHMDGDVLVLEGDDSNVRLAPIAENQKQIR